MATQSSPASRPKLYVSPQEFSDLREWSLLPEHEYVSRMLERYPHLWDHLYQSIEVVVRQSTFILQLSSI